MPDNPEFTQVLHSWMEVFMRRSMHDFHQFSKERGLSMVQLSTLHRLYHQQHCGVTDLGDHLGVTNAAASQMIDRLVQQGFMERSEAVHDRRAKQITLTTQGRLLVEESIEARGRWMEGLTTELSVMDQQGIIQALSLLTQAALQLDPVAQERKPNKSVKE